MLTALLLLLSAALGADPIHLPVRVHLIAAPDAAVDSARSVGAEELRQRFADINRAFAPAGIVWEIESVVVDRPGAEAAYRSAITDRSQRRGALRAMRSAPHRLGAEGFDLYVLNRLDPVGIGGAYQCAADEPAGMGAAFVAARTKRGGKLATRKWAHELGHALGLQHTSCEAATQDRMMMSGKCEHAARGRVGFTEAEITRMRAQAATGHAAPCKGRSKRRSSR